MKTKLIFIPFLIVLVSVASFYIYQYKKNLDLNKKSISKEKYQDLFPNKFSETYKFQQKHAPRPLPENIDPAVMPHPQQEKTP